MVEADQVEEVFEALGADPSFAGFAKPGAAVLAWASDGRLAGATPGAERLAAALVDGQGRLEADHPLLSRLLALAGGLAPPSGARLERLRFDRRRLAPPVTCACRRATLSDGGAVLVTAVVGPVPTLAPRAAPAPVWEGGGEFLDDAGPEQPDGDATHPPHPEVRAERASEEASRGSAGAGALLRGSASGFAPQDEGGGWEDVSSSGPAPQDEEHGWDVSPSSEPAFEEPEPFDPLAGLRGRGTVRFIWKADAEGRFVEVSDALGEVVGWDVVSRMLGRRWDELVGEVVLDPSGIVAEFLARRETWSGRTVRFVLEDTGHSVAVDLAGMPAWSRDRQLAGFRGFGLCRTDDLLPLPDDRPGEAAPAEDIAARVPEEAQPEPSFETEPRLGPELALPLNEVAPRLADLQDSESVEGAAPAEIEAGGDPGGMTDDAPEPKTFEAGEDGPPVGPEPVWSDEGSEPVVAAGAVALGDDSVRDEGAEELTEAGPAADESAIEPFGSGVTGLSLTGAVSGRLGEPGAAPFLADDELGANDELRANDGPGADPGLESAAPQGPAWENGQPIRPPHPEARGVSRASKEGSRGSAGPEALLRGSVSGFAPQDEERGWEETSSSGPISQDEGSEGDGLTPSELTAEEPGAPPEPLSDPLPGPLETARRLAAAAVEAPSAPGRLSSLERNAFREIARALGARIEGEVREEPRQESRQESRLQSRPAAAALAEPGAELALLDRLPAGLLIHRGDAPLFLNRLLLDWVGYASLAELASDGGVPRLFRGVRPEAEGGPVILSTREGRSLPVEARLTTAPWEGAPASLMLLRRAPDAELGQRLRAAEAELGAAEARARELASILDTATDGVAVIDEAGRLLSLNRSAEALFGYDQREVEGDLFTALLAPESHAAALDYLQGLKAGDFASLLNDGREVMGRVRQGGAIPLFMTLGRVGDGPEGSSSEAKFCAVLRDITASKTTERDLLAAKRRAEEASAQKSDVLARISHEVRTPLNAIIGFAEVMLEERFGPLENERYRDYLRDVHDSGRHVVALVNDLLDLAKIEAGRMELTFGRVALNDVAAAGVALIQPQAARERIVVRTGFAPRLPAIVADERSLRQIVLNLVSNAVKFTDAGGQVIVSTALTDRGEVAFRVRDTGIGMSAEEVEAALEPFRQVSATRRADGKGQGGTGLGLPLTKALVEANRGQFQITSRRDEGTLVEVVFPPERVLTG